MLPNAQKSGAGLSRPCAEAASASLPWGCGLAPRACQSKDLGWWHSTWLVLVVLRPSAGPTAKAKVMNTLLSDSKATVSQISRMAARIGPGRTGS